MAGKSSGDRRKPRGGKGAKNAAPAKAIRVGVIDYGGGNLRNVLNVLKYLGHEGSLVSGPNDFAGIDRLVFPGVGAFGDCAGELDRRGLRAR